MSDFIEMDFIINGRRESYRFNPGDTLLKVLRDNGHTEVHNGCESGDCGACVVIMDGRTVNSCAVFAATASEREIITVKGIGSVHKPHPIQTAFAEAGAIQCGFCTPGQIMSTYALLMNNPDPGIGEIKKALDGNLCRCTGYKKIIEAVQLSASRMREADNEA